MEPPAVDQRLGKRRDAAVPIDATWPVARKARLRTRINPEAIRIVNVSPTGAGLIAPTVSELVRGSRTRVDVTQLSCAVTVRRVEPVDDTTTYYGVRFVNPEPDFVDALLELAGAPAREKMESYWNSST